MSSLCRTIRRSVGRNLNQSLMTAKQLKKYARTLPPELAKVTKVAKSKRTGLFRILIGKKEAKK